MQTFKTITLKQIIMLGALSLSFIGLTLLSNNILAESETSTQNKQCQKYGHHKRHGRNPEQMLTMLDKKLELTEQQRNVIGALIEQYKPEFNQLQERIKSSRESKRALMQIDNFNEDAIRSQARQHADVMVEMSVLRAKMKYEIDKTLTVEQKQQLKERFNKHHKHRYGDTEV